MSEAKKRSFIESALVNHNIVMLLVGMLVLTGIWGLIYMPKQEMPVFTIRQGAVVAVCPGMSSLDIEQRVAPEVENFIFSYEEVNKAKTRSVSEDGMLIVYVQLGDEVEDKDAFWAKVKHGLSALKLKLPSGVLAVQAVDDIADTSALLVTIESKEKTYRELNTYIKDIKNKLRSIDAISNLRTYGLENEQVSVYLDQNKLSKYGIGPAFIMSTLSSQGFTTMSGTVENGKNNAPVYISDSYNCERDIAQQIIYSSPQGDVVRLKDIARIEREYPRLDKYIKYNDNKCVLLSVEMRPGNDIVKMGEQVRTLLDKYEQELPDDVNVHIITDQSKVVSESVINFLRELLISVLAVILVVVILMPRRVAEVSAMTIPITIFTSVGLFFIFGMELNTVTLAALIVTLGMVVDDSVVIIDNYMEKLGSGMTRRQATIAAPREFFMSVLSATLSISLTFFPFLLTMKGDMADFVKTFPWAMFIILTVSLSISLLLTPYLQFKFIKKGLVVENVGATVKKKKNPLDYLQDGYTWLLTRCFNHPMLTISGALFVVAVGGLLFAAVPQRMMPIAERNQFAVEIYMPNGSSAQQTATVADSLRNIMKKDKRIVGITTFVGQGSPRFHTTYAPQIGGPNFAQFIVNTIDDEATQGVLDDYANKYREYFPNAYVRFKQMDYNNAISPIEIRISGDSIKDIVSAAHKIEGCMRKIDGLQLIRDDFGNPLPGVSVKLNDTEANRLGVNKTLLSANMALRFGNGIPVSTVWEDDYPVSVVLKSDYSNPDRFAALPDENIPVMGGTASVPLRQIATIKPSYTYGAVCHRNGIRTISVLAEPMNGYNVNNITKKIMSDVEKLDLPSTVTVNAGGMYERDTETLPQVFGGVSIAVLIIFFILLFHFRKISLALVNLSSMSLCILGAVLGLLITGYDMSLTGVLGVVSLMGILVRNGIIMLDYAEELRRDNNMTVREAAFKAGERRMRPIFLTSAAASVGVLPMMLEGNTLWSPMAAVIFFGTLISMVLIATVLPVFYWVVFKKMDYNVKSLLEE